MKESGLISSSKEKYYHEVAGMLNEREGNEEELRSLEYPQIEV